MNNNNNKNRITRLSVSKSVEIIPDSSAVTLTPNRDVARKCMFCTLDILNRPPVGCPIKHVEKHNNLKYSDREHAGEYITYGIFCSYNCALAFALERSNDIKFTNSQRYIALMVKNETGEAVDVIPSPPKELMEVYGGYMTEGQYKLELGKIAYTSNGVTITYPVSLVFNRW